MFTEDNGPAAVQGGNGEDGTVHGTAKFHNGLVEDNTLHGTAKFHGLAPTVVDMSQVVEQVVEEENNMMNDPGITVDQLDPQNFNVVDHSPVKR